MNYIVKKENSHKKNWHLTIDSNTPKPDLFLVGGKAYSLYLMQSLGLNVPPACVFTVDLWHYFSNNKQNFPIEFDLELGQVIHTLECQTGKKFGCDHNPLLVSVRSGAEISMPGIMETILNIGLNSQNAFLYHNQFKMLISQFAEIVYDTHLFYDDDAHFSDVLELFKQETGFSFPENVFEQATIAIKAVLQSTNSARALRYRTIHQIQSPMATAVIVQSMVFGDDENDKKLQGAGVAVSRNPITGAVGMVGEFVPNESGMNLVSGKANPLDFNQFLQEHEEQFKPYYVALESACRQLEVAYKAPVEIEFTIDSDVLYFLQSRVVKVSDEALIETSLSLYQENIIDINDVLLRIPPKVIERQIHPQIVDNQTLVACGSGISASPGVATGHLVFTPEDAIQLAAEEKNVILMRYDTSPNDIHGMYAANGIVTVRGGMTSHAAVAARGMGRPCVTGVSKLEIKLDQEKCFFGDIALSKYDIISVDGTTGKIYPRPVAIKAPEPSSVFLVLNELSKSKARMQVRVNADTVQELKIAEKFGFDGVGLCRTETSFLREKSGIVLQHLIINNFLGLNQNIDTSPLLQEQVSYYQSLFTSVQGKAITLRLLDPPLQNIFPKKHNDLIHLAEILSIDQDKLIHTITDMTENNPTIGWRGSRLGILYPEIYRLQTECILRAAGMVHKNGIEFDLEIMIPFISFVSEFIIIKQQILSVYHELLSEFPDLKIPKIGIMIEVPRAALCAGALALQADFLSFGTNDLTQTVLGISRDDAPHFMVDYLKRGIVPFDPFISMDLEGVGVLIRTAVIEAKNANPNIVLGLCGEHGADPNCVVFCERIGINYLSCSPYRIAGARLSAAQAVLLQE